MIFELSERRLKKKNSIIFCGLSIRRGRGVVRVCAWLSLLFRTKIGKKR